MDFVARAGALIDKSHRIVGVLLVIIVLQSVLIMWIVSGNRNLANHLSSIRKTLPVYVVPGSTGAIYRPETGEMLINAFVDFLTQSLHTFTYESYQGQYEEVKKFFTPEMLRFADSFFGAKIRDSRNLKASEHFIPNRQTLRINTVQEGEEKIKIVTLRGSLQQIINGSVIQTRPVEFTLKLRHELVTKENPFGLMVLSFKTREIGG
ncbi:MAG: DUF2895 family protein [Alphaproteobacteria bacterium]|nr:DUF2895 family protein [Alphaproteobacteria bacterium]